MTQFSPSIIEMCEFSFFIQNLLNLFDVLTTFIN